MKGLIVLAVVIVVIVTPGLCVHLCYERTRKRRCAAWGEVMRDEVRWQRELATMRARERAATYRANERRERAAGHDAAGDAWTSKAVTQDMVAELAERKP